MVLHQSNRDVQIPAYKILTLLSVSPSLASHDIARIQDALLISLHSQADNPSMCNLALLGLHETSSNPNAAATIDHAARMCEILPSIIPHQPDPAFCRGISTTLTNLIFGHEAQHAHALDVGAIPALLGLLRLPHMPAETCLQCAVALHNLVLNNPQSRPVMLQTHTLSDLFVSLRYEGSTCEVATKHLAILEYLVNLPSACAAIAANSEWVATLWRMLIRHATDGLACQHALTVLCRIATLGMCGAREGAHALMKACKDEMLHGAVVRALQDVFATKKGSGELVGLFAQFIQRMCVVDEFRVDMSNTELTCVLTACATEFVKEKDVVVDVLNAVDAIMAGHARNKRGFHEAGGVLVVRDVMRTHNTCLSILSTCCQVLDTSAEEQGWDYYFPDEEVLNAMRDFPHCASLQRCACSVLIKICSGRRMDAVTRLYTCGARDVVENARSLHSNNLGVECLANHLLSLLKDEASPRASRPGLIAQRVNSSARLRSRPRTSCSKLKGRRQGQRSVSRGRMCKGRRRPDGDTPAEENLGAIVNVTRFRALSEPAGVKDKKCMNKQILESIYE